MKPKKAEKKRLKKIRKKNDEIYKLIGLLGFVFIIGTVVLFNTTIIDLGIILLIIFVFGLLGFYFDKGRYLFTYKLSGKFGQLRSVFFYLFSIGSFASFLVLSLNYYIPSGHSEIKEYTITGRHSTTGRKYHRSEREPVFVIVFEGEKKEFHYPHRYLKDMNTYKTISVETEAGLFGFRYIKGNTLNK